jgi:hypothetical protein
LPHYRLYLISNYSGHIDQVENVHAVDDLHAIRMVRRFIGRKAMELWCQHRRVRRFRALAPVPGPRLAAVELMHSAVP